MKILVALVATSAVVAATASAKEIRPGTLWICGARDCRVMQSAQQARAFSELLWGERRVARAPTPPVGSPVYQLKFEYGSAGAIMRATAIRVHGLNCGRFKRGRWYRLPTPLRDLTNGLEPKRLGARVPHSC